MTGLAVAGVGGALVVTGAMFALKAWSAGSDAEALTPGSTWDPAIEDRGQRAETRAWVTLGLGGAAIVGGTVLYLRGRPGERPPSVSLRPAPGGAALVWAGGF